jgi:CRISPR-associated protein Cmr6
MTEDWKKALSEAYNISLQKGIEKGKKGYPKQEKKGNLKHQEQHGDKEMPNRYLPLYKDFKKIDYTKPRHMEGSAHTGLLFDKFCDHWSGPAKWKEQIDARRKQDIPRAITNHPTWDANPKTWFLKSIVKQHNGHTITPDLLKSYHTRRSALIAALNGKICNFTTAWRFVSGLGMGHVLETGFVWHRILGVPYLPGSSVKGMIRAWAEQWGNEQDKKNAVRLFGPKGEDARKNPDTGALIVFDAIPESKPKLELDIMNPHYGDYYSKKIVNGQPVPPADYLSPNPIFFLTVAPDVSFKFALAPRLGFGNSMDLKNGYDLLKEALENIGAGAKTAVGYGYFEEKK